MVTVTVTDDGDPAESIDVPVIIPINDNVVSTVTITDGVVVPGLGETSNLTVAENVVGADIAYLASIVVTDPDAADADRLTGDAGELAIEVIDPGYEVSRFEVKLDDEGGLWLVLKADAKFNYETEQSVTVTVTFTDSDDNVGHRRRDGYGRRRQRSTVSAGSPQCGLAERRRERRHGRHDQFAGRQH